MTAEHWKQVEFGKQDHDINKHLFTLTLPEGTKQAADTLNCSVVVQVVLWMDCSAAFMVPISLHTVSSCNRNVKQRNKQESVVEWITRFHSKLVWLMTLIKWEADCKDAGYMLVPPTWLHKTGRKSNETPPRRLYTPCRITPWGDLHLWTNLTTTNSSVYLKIIRRNIAHSHCCHVTLFLHPTASHTLCTSVLSLGP
jgi:hypothetical protein